jgi:FlaA1/EpsC-like NDP-sugar epimerase
VVEIFREQIARGGPVTLTDSRMTRFVMGLPHAVQLLLRAAELTVGGELFVLKMPALRISDLAQVMIQRLAPAYGFRPEDIQVTEIGPKPGEKLFEELLSDAEVPHAYEDDDLILYPGEVTDAETFVQRPFMRYMRPVESVYHSERCSPMSEREIEAFLVEMGVLGSLSGQEVAL